MAGYTINGFGASDSYYPIKELTGQKCFRCGKADMALMELRMKIRVLYIPTFTIGKKFGVVCPKCKEGFYVSDEQRVFILSHDSSCVGVTAEGITFHEDDLPAPAAQPAEVPEPTPAPEVKSVVASKPEASCGHCGAALIPGALFCMKCGAKVGQQAESPAEKAPVKPGADVVIQPEVKPVSAAPEAALFVYTKSKVCPECGMYATGNKETCSICGAKLI